MQKRIGERQRGVNPHTESIWPKSLFGLDPQKRLLLIYCMETLYPVCYTYLLFYCSGEKNYERSGLVLQQFAVSLVPPLAHNVKKRTAQTSTCVEPEQTLLRNVCRLHHFTVVSSCDLLLCQRKTGIVPPNMALLSQRTVGTLSAAAPPQGILHHGHLWPAGTDHSSGRPAEIRSGSTAPAAWPSTRWHLG